MQLIDHMLQLIDAAIFQDALLLIDDINVSVSGKDKKRIGIIGPNGSGKTTLLNLFLGIHDTFEGVRVCERERVVKVDQTLRVDLNVTAIEYVSAVVEAWEAYKIEKLQQVLGVSDDMLLQSMGTLSGGEQMKIMIMIALLQEPSILLLDEPTNHLDAVACDWLVGFLRSFQGSVIVITHDRYIIDSLCTELWDIEPSRQALRVYKGTFENLVVLKEQERENSVRYYEMVKARADVLRKWLKANEQHPKYRFSSFVASRKKSLERLEEELALPPVEIPSYTLPRTSYASSQGQLVHLRIDSLKEVRDVRILGIELRIRRGQHILIAGPNGSGKSTFLTCIEHPDFFEGWYEKDDDVHIAHLSQHPHFTDKEYSMRVLHLLEQRLPFMQSVYGVALRGGFTKDQLYVTVGNLSEGQKRRLELLLLLYEKHDLLLLDEPTNHMDIYMKEELLRYMRTTKVTTVMVTHDRYMQEAVKWDQKVVLG